MEQVKNFPESVHIHCKAYASSEETSVCSQWAFGGKMTSYQRQFDVIT